MILMNPHDMETKPDTSGGADAHVGVLVVDDEEIVRNLIVLILRQAGCRVQEARNADEACAIIKMNGSAIDVLLTDEVMPGFSGSRLADLVVRALPHVRVIVMSGFIESDHAVSHIRDAGRRFLSKPFAVEELKEVVRGGACPRPEVLKS